MGNRIVTERLDESVIETRLENISFQQGGRDVQFTATTFHLPDGRWLVRNESQEWGRLETTADTLEQAVEKLRREIRYRLELCPCTGETYQDVEVEIITSHDSTPVGRELK